MNNYEDANCNLPQSVRLLSKYYNKTKGARFIYNFTTNLIFGSFSCPKIHFNLCDWFRRHSIRFFLNSSAYPTPFVGEITQNNGQQKSNE
jgi:hypothetical protein